MIFSSNRVRIVVATQPVDFRKGLDDLAAVVKCVLRKDPFTGTVFVFRAKRADRLKPVYWDGTGQVMAYKRLERQSFVWPTIRDGVITLESRRARGVVRRSGLASGAGAFGSPAVRGGMTQAEVRCSRPLAATRAP